MKTCHPEDLAQHFINDVRGLLLYLERDVEATVKQINALNAAEGDNIRNTCHSHDFCDANQAMISALEDFGIEFDGEDEAQAELGNEAWRIAKEWEFAAEIPEPDNPCCGGGWAFGGWCQ